MHWQPPQSAAAPAAPAAAARLATTASAAPQITVQPGVIHPDGRLSAPSPLDCQKEYHVTCYLPSQLRQAYNLPALYARGITGKGETIVIVDAFGSPTITRDLGVFDKRFGLPAPPSFTIIRPDGALPPWIAGEYLETGWGAETTLDVEYAHTVAPGARILLVETPIAETEGVTGFPQIVKAEDYVLAHYHADVISQSFSTTEQTFTGLRQISPLRAAYVRAAAEKDGPTIVDANAFKSVTGAARGVPDISMSGACEGAVVTYQSFPEVDAPPGWYPACGTSEATPELAGIVALASQLAGHPLGLINPTLYRLSADKAPGIVPVTRGNNTVTFTEPTGNGNTFLLGRSWWAASSHGQVQHRPILRHMDTVDSWGVAGARYRRPYAVPERLDLLRGPSSGTVRLPPYLDWSGNAVYDLDAPGRVVDLYRAVLIEAATPQDLYAYLDEKVLRRLWALLWLPVQLRRAWEQRFPVLAEISRVTATA